MAMIVKNGSALTTKIVGARALENLRKTADNALIAQEIRTNL
jgi:hypothetical protein